VRAGYPLQPKGYFRATAHGVGKNAPHAGIHDVLAANQSTENRHMSYQSAISLTHRTLVKAVRRLINTNRGCVSILAMAYQPQGRFKAAQRICLPPSPAAAQRNMVNL
jgi:hypothetical protein